MKGKSIFLALGLSLTMGIGVAASLHGAKEIKPADAATTSVKVAGSFTNWATNAIDMNLDGSYYTYQRDFALDEEFKVVVNNSDWIGANWNGVTNNTNGGIVDGGADDHNFKVATAGTYLVKAVNNIGDYGEKGYGLTLEIPGVPDSYSLVGSFNGNDVSDTTYDMALEAGVATYSNLHLDEDDTVKISLNHSWGTTYGYSNLTNASKAYFKTTDGYNNMIAKEDGTYSFSFTPGSSEISVDFVADTVEYYVKVANGEYVLMNDAGTFDYEDGEHNPHTGYIYTATISADEGQKLFFKRNAAAIEPGASDDDLLNNLFWRNDNHQISVLQDVDDGQLTLRVYHDGYDAKLSGYVSHPNTYYFSNNKGWAGAPRFYAYDDNKKPLKAWGESDAMTYVDSNSSNERRYSFTLDDVKFPYVVLCSNDRTDQSTNIHLPDYTNNAFYLLDTKDGENHWQVSSYLFVEAVRQIYVGGVAYGLDESAVQPSEAGLLVQLESGDIDMTAGDQITYRVDSVAMDGAVLQAYGRNNAKLVETQKQVLVDATAKVYIKLYEDGSIKIMVNGIHEVAAGYHVFLNDNGIIPLADSGETPDGFDGQTCSEAVTFHENDKFKLVDTSSNSALPTVFVAGGGLDPASDEHFIMNDGYIKYTGTADFEAKIYLKLKSGADVVYIEMADPNMVKARDFAAAFNTAIGAVCKWDGSTDRSDLEDAWDDQATIFRSSALTDDARNILKSDYDSHVTEIEDFKDKYESVLRLRKLAAGWDLEDFMEKNYSSNSVRLVSTNNSTLIIVLISITVVCAGAVAVYMTIRRRKYDK